MTPEVLHETPLRRQQGWELFCLPLHDRTTRTRGGVVKYWTGILLKSPDLFSVKEIWAGKGVSDLLQAFPSFS